MINWNRRSYTKEQFIEAWNSSYCVSDVVRKLLPKSNISSGMIRQFSLTAVELELSNNHFDKSAARKNHVEQGGGIKRYTLE